MRNTISIIPVALLLLFTLGCGGDDGASPFITGDATNDIPTVDVPFPDGVMPDDALPDGQGWDGADRPSDVIIPQDLAVDDTPLQDTLPPQDTTGPEVVVPAECVFDYGFPLTTLARPETPTWPMQTRTVAEADLSLPASIAWDDPLPPGTYELSLPDQRASIVMPAYSDNMPLFSRGRAWTVDRCYATPSGYVILTEDEAWQLYKDIAEKTTGVSMRTATNVRTVVGIRGAYPGMFRWHGNAPNLFNDSLALLWRDSAGKRHVREFPIHTDTGAHDFGADSSSSLLPNRRYHHINGWHRAYNALPTIESGYHVQDDTNNNGHWDSDRNGWLPPLNEQDYERTGSGHNIHMGSVDAPLGAALVDLWSAGCQVIPGMANWTEFITNAWTQLSDEVDYYLVDARDIDPTVWGDCTPDGSHACPFRLNPSSFMVEGNTTLQGERDFDRYNCSNADESGPELVYVFTTDRSGILNVELDPGLEGVDEVDVDIHLLTGDDANACKVRSDKSFVTMITPGRYLLVVDTFVEGGKELSGPFRVSGSLE